MGQVVGFVDLANMKIGILHPGAMGISVAASAQKDGHPVYWASEGRSQETASRAEEYGLIDAVTLSQLCETCELIISVCPPHAAEDVAGEVIAHGYKGLFVDANAISPDRVQRISEAMSQARVKFVDGGIIGGPAWTPESTWLYLCGSQAQVAADCFREGPLETAVIGSEIGRASALKMCYAAFTKGSTALLCAIMAVAEELEVREELERQWSQDDPDFPERTRNRVRRVTAKAWRFAGEMDEISATFRSAGMPGEFHAAAGEVYRRMAHFKGLTEWPPLADVLASLIDPEAP